MRLLPVRYRPYTVVLTLFVLSHYCGCRRSHRGECSRVRAYYSFAVSQFPSFQLIAGTRNNPPRKTRGDGSQDGIG